MGSEGAEGIVSWSPPAWEMGNCPYGGKHLVLATHRKPLRGMHRAPVTAVGRPDSPRPRGFPPHRPPAEGSKAGPALAAHARPADWISAYTLSQEAFGE